jgi:eukaryotic-like serine/threonine-protein kinase
MVSIDGWVVMTEASGVIHEWPGTGSLLSLRYRLTEKLATGGMAEIWRADDELLGRAVAIKLPMPRAAEILHEAWIEARTTARLAHPHIAAVYDYGEAPRSDGSVVPYVVMELLDGESLAARLVNGPLPWQDAAGIGAEVAAGLAMAHAQRVVHRDIKPGNIMLTPTGTKVLDFGISAPTGAPDDDETGATFGTPAYTAPERLNGTPAEPATDVYALGTVLFEMVNGDPPYPVATWEEFEVARAWDRFAIARATATARLPEDLPTVFRQLIDHCLAEDPRLRPEAFEVRDTLAALRPGPLPAEPPARRRVPVAARVAMAVLLLVAGAAIGLVAWPSNRTNTPTTAPNHTEPSTSTTTPLADPSPTTGSSPPPSGTEPAVQEDVGFTEAVDSVISAVESGRASGQIRPDVAVDLTNLLRQLRNAAPGEVSRRVAELQQKIRARIGEGSLARAYATEISTGLERVDRVAQA